MVFTLVLVAAAVALIDAPRAHGTDSDRCARFAAASSARARIITGSGPRTVVLGDSYSVGLGLPDARLSWPTRLPGRVQVFGFSGSGFGTASSPCPDASYADRVGRAARGTGLVVVEGGLNDFDQPPAAVRAGLHEVLTALQGHRIVVVGPVRAPARARAVPRVDRLLATECARAGVPYVSMTGLRLPYLADGLHLTAAGHRTFGNAVARAVRSDG